MWTRACLSRWSWLCNCGDCSTVSYYRLREPSDEAAVPPVPVRYHEPVRCTLGLAPRGLTRRIDRQPHAPATYRVRDDTSNQGSFVVCPRSDAVDRPFESVGHQRRIKMLERSENITPEITPKTEEQK